MNNRSLTLSLIIAGLSMFMVYSYIESIESEQLQKYGNPLPVVVASENIKELEVIDDRKVTIINVPEKFRQPGHIDQIEKIFGMIATVPIIKGEQITSPRVTFPGVRTGLANQISVGKRAYAINVSGNSAVAKLIKPGDRVDVYAAISYAPGKLDRNQVKTVLQDILVLSTGMKVTNALPLIKVEKYDQEQTVNLNKYTDYSTVSLELTPEEVQKMVYLNNLGADINLSLRNNDDKTIKRVPATKIYDVMGESAGEARQYFESRRKRDL